MVIDGELALDANGKFTGVRIRSNNNVGAYLTMIGFISTNGITQTPVGTYLTPAAHAEANSVFTNTVPVSNYRAPGGVPGTYVLERMIDMAAADMGIDPAEIRRRNLIPPESMPYKSPLGGGYDCGEFEKVLDKALEKADYANVAARRTAAEARGKLFGVGVSSSVDPSAGPSPENRRAALRSQADRRLFWPVPLPAGRAMRPSINRSSPTGSAWKWNPCA